MSLHRLGGFLSLQPHSLISVTALTCSTQCIHSSTPRQVIVLSTAIHISQHLFSACVSDIDLTCL